MAAVLLWDSYLRLCISLPVLIWPHALVVTGALLVQPKELVIYSDFIDADMSDDTRQAPNGLQINFADIRRKARTFGQSPKEHQQVRHILKAVNSIIASRVGLNLTQNSDIDLLQSSSADQIQRSTALESSDGVEKSSTSVSSPYTSRPKRPLRLKSERRRVESKLNYLKQKVHKSSMVPGRFLDNQFAFEAPEQSGDHFEGDIVLWQDQAEDLLDQVIHKNDRRQKRKFIRSNVRRWDPSQSIEYSFDGSHSLKEQEYIELALQHWQNITCLDFVRRDDPPRGNRIVFTDVDGCASNVGRHPLGEPQFVSIARECLRLGVIAHEVAHALGFWHEQSRPDRDDFVTVLWNNIEWGSAGQFTKEMLEDVDSAGISYDYGSIMHYRSKAFSRENNLYTIQTNVGDFQRTIGQRDQLSFNDIRLMNTMYCQSCGTKLPCLRGGYTDPRKCDRCRCPDGFTGQYCDKTMTGFGASCGGEIVVGESEVYISSPEYPGYFKKGQECSWLAKAPRGMHVEFEFVESFDLYCKAQHSLCMDYVEIRNSTDFANTGMRYCCYDTPRGQIYSDSNELLVLFRSFYNGGRGFKAKIRAVSSSGVWAAWGLWSECTASCGGCGTRIRYRTCSDSVCVGRTMETESCNTQPCTECSQMKRVVVPCGLWGLFRCEKVSAATVPCSEECCPGYRLINGVCSLNGR